MPTTRTQREHQAADNARAHLAAWEVQLPLSAGAGDVRVEWGDGTTGVQTEPVAAVRDGVNWVSVHSARDPRGEARRWLDRDLPSGAGSHVVVVGAGLGYVVEALLDRSTVVRVLVLEPEPGLIPGFLARRDWTGAIESGRLLIVPGPDFQQRMSVWRILTPLPSAMPILVHPAIARARPGAVAAAREVVKAAARGAASNARAGDRFAPSILINTLNNLPALAREAPVSSLAGEARGRAAVVVGAGPSLTANIEALRLVRERVVLVAAGTSLKPLVAAGLPPDLVVAVDPGEFTHHQFAGLSADATWLVAEASVDPRIIDSHAGRTFLFRVGSAAPWPWLMAHGVDPGRLRAWGSVITSAFDLVVTMGCDPVVLIGSDLAYTGGRTHAAGTFKHEWVRHLSAVRGTTEDEEWATMVSPHTVTAIDVNGAEVGTSCDMLEFRDWLVQQSCALTARIVNATGAGILCGGRIEQGTLAEVVADQPPFSRACLRERHAAMAGGARRSISGALRGLAGVPETWASIADRVLLARALASAASSVGGGGS